MKSNTPRDRVPAWSNDLEKRSLSGSGRGPRERAAWGRPLVAILALALAGLLQGCLQQISVEPDRAIVTGALVVDGTGGRANVRVDVSGTAPARTNASRDLLLTDAAYTDENGTFIVQTQNSGDNFFAVARHPEYFPEVGKLDTLSIGGTTTLTSFFPLFDVVTGDPTPTLEPATLFRKTPGRVKFIFVRSETTFDKLVSVEVLGDFNGFSKTTGLILLFDDGSGIDQEDEDGNIFFSGDAVVNDGVFVRVVDGLPPGRLRYNFLLNSNLVIRDLFEEGSEEMVDENNLRVTRSVTTIK